MPYDVWNGCSYLSIDPGINVTGFARYKITNTGQLQLLDFGAIKPPTSYKTLEQVRYITGALKLYTTRHRFAWAFVENPPDTVYEGNKRGMNYMIARAQSIFKLVGVAYSIYQMLADANVIVRPVLPAEWQERSKKKRGGEDIKSWSLGYANSVLQSTDLNFTGRVPYLQSKIDENIADAISLGHLARIKGFSPAD